MFIRTQDEYTIPVSYASCEELGIKEFLVESLGVRGCGNLYREMSNNTAPLQRAVKSKIDYIYNIVESIFQGSDSEKKYNILKNIYGSVLRAHINNIPCLPQPQQQNYNYHMNNFIGIYDFHNSAFNCDGYIGNGTTENNQLNEKLKFLDSEIQRVFKELKRAVDTAGATEDDILALHKYIITTILTLLADTIPCLGQAKSNLDKIIDMHIKRFVKTYNKIKASLIC